jgi:hypothetical protein
MTTLFVPQDYGLFPVRVETMGNMVFVCLDSGAPPLKTVMGMPCCITGRAARPVMGTSCVHQCS